MPKLKKEKIYAIKNTKIMSKWDYDENNKNGIDPNVIPQGSHTKAYFKCPDCGHKWFGEVRYADRYNGCEKCMKKARSISNIKTKLKNGLPLFKTNPELKNEWDFELNEKDGISPDLVMAGTNKEAHWVCPKGHRYTSYIMNRAKNHTGCTYCSGQAILIGFNDLATTRPDLIKEWDYEKNNTLGLTPQNVMRGSHEKAYWICPLGHEYTKEIKLRDAGQGCTICAKESQTSFPEQAICYYLSKCFREVKNRYGKPEIDIYIPELQFGIEYDGLYAHKKKSMQEHKKDVLLQEKGIFLLRVKEVKNKISNTGNILYCKADNNYKYLESVLADIIKIINRKYNLHIDIELDIDKDRIKIEEQYINSLKENSIKVKKPELLKEWDYDKNGKIKPEFVSYGSSKKYWWKCEHGHSYLHNVKSKKLGVGCQECTRINIYDLHTGERIDSIIGIKNICNKLNLDYKKQINNIYNICVRRRETLDNKYTFRYVIDDELKEMLIEVRKQFFHNMLKNKR